MSGAAPFGVKGADFDFLFPLALATKFASNRLSDEDSRPERVRLDGRVDGTFQPCRKGSHPFSKSGVYPDYLSGGPFTLSESKCVLLTFLGSASYRLA